MHCFTGNGSIKINFPFLSNYRIAKFSGNEARGWAAEYEARWSELMLINALWTWGGMFNILINHFTEFSSQPRPSFYHGVSHGFPFNLVKICKNIFHISYLRIFPYYKIFREMVIIPFNLFHAKNIWTSYMTIPGRWLDVLPVFLRVGQVDVTHGDSNLDTNGWWLVTDPPSTDTTSPISSFLVNLSKSKTANTKVLPITSPYETWGRSNLLVDDVKYFLDGLELTLNLNVSLNTGSKVFRWTFVSNFLFLSGRR